MFGKSSSPALLAHQTQQAEWARVWHGLTPTQRNGFQALAETTTPKRKNGKPRMGAFFLFATINTALANCGRQPITTAPTAFVVPPSIPEPLFLASVATPGQFSLLLSAATDYPNAVIIYAAPPVMAGTNVYRDSAFKVIGYVPSLGDDINITSLYVKAFRAPQIGEKVALKLVGVSSTGSATTKFFVAAVTSNVAASASDNNDTNLEMVA